MSKYKVNIDFSNYSGPALAPVAQQIHDQMTVNAATFPAPTISLPTLAAASADYEAKLAAKASRAINDQVSFNLSRHSLELDLAELGDYVNLFAQGNVAILMLSGFPYYDTARTSPDTAPPAAPTGLVLHHGDLSGTVDARFHPDRVRSMNELQTCTGDPNTPANWTYAGMFSGGKATLGGLTPATTIWVRARTAGLKGVMGAWSDPASIIVV